jgi:cellulose synthase/poly-beta-1,6-N-acetylglucosamine synthase-like glycosyltransferase
MHALVSYVLVVSTVLIAVPVIVFFLEIVAATIRPVQEIFVDARNGNRARIAVIVPAHNESVGILPTLADIKAQLRPTDRLLVVADNCADDTASVAAAAGAEVIERNDREKIGKGYALDWGLKWLSKNPPDIVVVVDADCRLSDLAIDQLARTCISTKRPAQALYLMKTPSNSCVDHRVAEFAVGLKNWIRPLGLKALNLPCQLTGTGMAFPWDVICMADLASGSIVEDLKLGLDLGLAGAPAVFCPSAVITSCFPSSVEGTASQRSRWEGGHIGMLLIVPGLLWTALRRRDMALLALTLDVAVPPLSAIGILVAVMMVIAGTAALSGFSSVPLIISLITTLCLLIAVVMAWQKCGRDILPVGNLSLIPVYVICKIPAYLRILSGRTEARWIRTDRNNPS